jgi:hypothetical protein
VFIRHHRPHGPAWWSRPLTFEEVAEHRNVACGVYGICLEVVVRRGWPSFTCRPCSLWRRRLWPESICVGPAEILPLRVTGQRQAG